MNFSQIKELIDEHIGLITVDAKAIAGARDRAAKFLVIQSVLATYMKDLDVEKAKFSSVVDMQYSQALRTTDGKTITEKKVHVAENAEYVKYKDSLAELDAQRDWVKTHIKIFDNAHLTFRQYSRD
jgi:hypothetical protein